MGSNMEPNSIAFTCICDEPDGQILRTVKHFQFNQTNLDKLWNQISKFPTFMGQEISTKEDMLRFFVTDDLKPRGLCLVVDEFIGLFWLTDIKGLHEASVHYTFFDRRHKGRVVLCKRAIEFAFKAFHFHRLWTQVPLPAEGVRKFIETLGFKQVGRLRRSSFFRGRFHDTNVYDLLREEVLTE